MYKVATQGLLEPSTYSFTSASTTSTSTSTLYPLPSTLYPLPSTLLYLHLYLYFCL